MKFAPALLLLLMVAAMQLDISVLGDRTPPTHATPSPPGQHPHRHAHSWPKSRDTHKDAHELRGGRNELSHNKKSRAFSDWQVENQLLFDQFNDNTTERQTDSWKTSPHLMNADSQDLKMGADTSSNQSLWTIPQVGACHSTKGTGRVCRVGRRCLPAAIYALEACALCYSYIPTRNFKQKLRFRVQPFHSAHGLFNLTVLHNGTHAVAADPDNLDEMVLDSFKTESYQWTSCCQAAVECCHNMTSPASPSLEDACPRTWDGWQCWPDTPAGTVARRRCPDYIYYFTRPPSCPQQAYKQCSRAGTWYVGQGGAEWSNYSTCSTLGFLQDRVKVHLAAHLVSVIALLPAIVIFFLYKQLRVPRVVLHKNLFLSLLLNSSFVLAFLTTVMLRDDRHARIQGNSLGCVALLLLTKFCRLTSYMWMFCEAFYLHKLVASAFAEQRSLFVYYAIGWGFPINPVILYASFRASHANDQCWVVPADPYEWILNTPCLVALLLNVVFMINILRVLVTKLRAANTHEPSQYRKAVRAALVLIPLFGLHFLVTLYRPAGVACHATELYHHLNSCVDGLQGFFVALAFCYFNGEVQQLLRRTYRRWRDHRDPRKGHHRPSQYTAMGRSSATLLNTTCTSMDCTRYFEDGGIRLEPRGAAGRSLSIHQEDQEHDAKKEEEDSNPDVEIEEY